MFSCSLELDPLTGSGQLRDSDAHAGAVARKAQMKPEHRWRIGIETERILVVTLRNTTVGWCERCGQKVELLSAQSAEQFLGLSLDRIEKEGRRKFHLRRAKDGLVICLKSLLHFLQSADTENDPGDRPGGGNRK